MAISPVDFFPCHFLCVFDISAHSFLFSLCCLSCLSSCSSAKWFRCNHILAMRQIMKKNSLIRHALVWFLCMIFVCTKRQHFLYTMLTISFGCQWNGQNTSQITYRYLHILFRNVRCQRESGQAIGISFLNLTKKKTSMK